MNANEFLNLLEVQCDGVNRDGPNGLLFFTDIAQGILRNSPAEQNIVFDSTGKLPVLNTQNNVFDYNAPSDCWRIAGILIEANRRLTDYGFRTIDTDCITISGIDYKRVPYIRSFDAGDTSVAKIKFTRNPGAHAYRWWYYKKTGKLWSDTIPLSIEPPWDYIYLFPATVRLVQGFQDGDFIKAHNDVLVMRERYRKELNEGEQGEDLDAQDRGF